MLNESIVGRPHPHRCLFHTWEMRRIPVQMDTSTRLWIDACSSEGRKFPQALSEAFGVFDDVETLELSIVPRSDHFPGDAVLDQHPDAAVCRISVAHSERVIVLFLEASHLRETLPTGHPAFLAMGAAQELAQCDAHQRGY